MFPIEIETEADMYLISCGSSTHIFYWLVTSEYVLVAAAVQLIK
jgi:hypothetical protein